MISAFPAIAKREFDEIADRFDMKCIKVNERVVQYQNAEVMLQVTFDNGRSYELLVEIGLSNGNHLGQQFSLGDILRFQNACEAPQVTNIMVSNEVDLRKLVLLLASLTSKYCDRYLSGEEFLFAQLQRFQNRESAKYILSLKLMNAQSVLDNSWSRKDYKSIVKVLEPLRSHLPPSSVKKLDYSKKQLGQAKLN